MRRKVKVEVHLAISSARVGTSGDSMWGGGGGQGRDYTYKRTLNVDTRVLFPSRRQIPPRDEHEQQADGVDFWVKDKVG
jgi:hypothetical protein